MVYTRAIQALLLIRTRRAAIVTLAIFRNDDRWPMQTLRFLPNGRLRAGRSIVPRRASIFKPEAHREGSRYQTLAPSFIRSVNQ